MMKLLTFLGIAGAGTILYMNNKRGRNLTFDNFKKTGRELFSTAKDRAAQVKDREKEVLHGVATRVADATEVH